MFHGLCRTYLWLWLAWENRAGSRNLVSQGKNSFQKQENNMPASFQLASLYTQTVRSMSTVRRGRLARCRRGDCPEQVIQRCLCFLLLHYLVQPDAWLSSLGFVFLCRKSFTVQAMLVSNLRSSCLRLLSVETLVSVPHYASLQVLLGREGQVLDGNLMWAHHEELYLYLLEVEIMTIVLLFFIYHYALNC